MAYEVKQGNIFGRIGTGIGKGLSEQVPKEIDRYRLAEGLKKLGENKDLTPFQRFAELSSIPGITPQMVQSGADLLRQEAKSNSFKNFETPKTNETKSVSFPQFNSGQISSGGAAPSITQEAPLEQIQQGFIPRDTDQIISDAQKRYNENPNFFDNDPKKAIEFEESAEERRKSINEAYQKKHENLSNVQDNVVKRLRNHAENLGATGANATSPVPANVYSLVEDKAIQATKPKKDGGKGLTEQQAMKEYGKELDEISRQYSNINSIGNWGITGRPAKDTLRNLRNIQNDFEKRNDTRNMAAQLISVNKLSPQMAYSISEPVSKSPEINKILKSIPTLEGTETLFETVKDPDSIQKTIEISEKILPFINGKGSPLAIGYELEKKGYDLRTWLDYVEKNKHRLNNFTTQQNEQLSMPIPTMPLWNDWWLQSWSGIE